MERRAFLAVLASSGAATAAGVPRFSFAVLTDIQYADRPPNLKRDYRGSRERLSRAVAEINQARPAFAIQLGDLVDAGEESLPRILALYRGLTVPRYHVLGNHDFCIPRDQLLRQLGMENAWYDFAFGGWRFLVLDGMDISIPGRPAGTAEHETAVALLSALKARRTANAQEWNGAVGEFQKRWLREVLQRAAGQRERAIVFCHFPLLREASTENHLLWNSEEILRILDESPAVAAYLNGHRRVSGGGRIPERARSQWRLCAAARHPLCDFSRHGGIRRTEFVHAGGCIRGPAGTTRKRHCAVPHSRLEGQTMTKLMPACPLLACVAWATAAGQDFSVPPPTAQERQRINYHRVTSKGSPAPEPGAEKTPLLSPLRKSNGETVRTPEEWYRDRRPQIVRDWTAILGKIAPAAQDLQWFGDIRKAVIQQRRAMDGYIRIDLDIPIETDFYQRHLLLLPDKQGDGPFPAVIAWTSSTPDYREPEAWWGAYLARHGYVVLTGWSFIRNYREGSRLQQSAELVYQRFGHWLPIAKMVHDVAREIEYLRTVPQVDPSRIGFMGFSLSAKAAVYVAAFHPDVSVTVAVDPHIALNGGTNWYAPWYLDWRRKFDDIHTSGYSVRELRGTVQSLLNPDVERPGFEHDHHELLALVAPRAFLLIGGSRSEDAGGDSDDLESWGYVNSAKEVFTLLGVPERLQFCSTDQGHKATGEQSDPAWQRFLRYYLYEHPIKPGR